jgi:hypothetical protein
MCVLSPRVAVGPRAKASLIESKGRAEATRPPAPLLQNIAGFLTPPQGHFKPRRAFDEVMLLTGVKERVR